MRKIFAIVLKKSLVAVLALLCSVVSALAQEGRGNGQLIFKLNEKIFSQTSVSNGHRKVIAPAIVGAVETHWLVAGDDLGPNAAAAGFDRVVVADFTGSFMLPGLRGSKAERKNTLAIARRFFRDSMDVVEENFSDGFELLQSPPVANVVYPNDPFFSSQWALGPAGIGIASTWTPPSGLASIATSDVLSVVIDSGIAPIADLPNPNPTLSRTFFGTGLWNQDPGTTGLLTVSPHGHGTMVASVACAIGNNNIGIAGVDWNCNLISYRVFAPVTISTGVTVLSTSYEAVLGSFVASLDLPSNHIMINCSFAYSTTDVGDENMLSLWKDAIVALGDRGLVVAAAGNSGDTVPRYPAAFSLPNVIGVAATELNGTQTVLASFSTYGWPNIAAPGVNVIADSPDGPQTVSGTSFSSPLVFGFGGLLWKNYLALKSSELEQIILTGASFNPSLIGQIVGACQLSYQGSMTALQNLANGTTPNIAPQVSLSALVPAWTTEPGLAWGGIATAYGDNFTDGTEFISATPVTRLGNISILIGTIPMMLTYVGPHQINFQWPEDTWQFMQGGNGNNVPVVMQYDNAGNVLSWSAMSSVQPVAYNPGFLTGPDGKLFLDTLDNGETVLYAAGLGFTDPWVKAGTVGTGTERVEAKVQIALDDQQVSSSATASSRWAGVYEVRIPTPLADATTLTIEVGDWQKKFSLK